MNSFLGVLQKLQHPHFVNHQQKTASYSLFCKESLFVPDPFGNPNGVRKKNQEHIDRA